MALNESTAWAAIKAARNAARDSYLSGHTPPLSSAQVLELVDAMEEAAWGAWIDHVRAAATVAFTAQTATGLTAPPGGGPVTGALTVSGGRIT
jgi:hypothetical protein